MKWARTNRVRGKAKAIHYSVNFISKCSLESVSFYTFVYRARSLRVIRYRSKLVIVTKSVFVKVRYGLVYNVCMVNGFFSFAYFPGQISRLEKSSFFFCTWFEKQSILIRNKSSYLSSWRLTSILVTLYSHIIHLWFTIMVTHGSRSKMTSFTTQLDVYHENHGRFTRRSRRFFGKHSKYGSGMF